MMRLTTREAGPGYLQEKYLGTWQVLAADAPTHALYLSRQILRIHCTDPIICTVYTLHAL